MMMDPAFSKTSTIFDIGQSKENYLTELNELQLQIAHKQHELLVYSNAIEITGARSWGERCLVFLGDNIFIMRTREQALEILRRQVLGFQNGLKQLDQERAGLEKRVRLMDQLSITSEGLVEIREPVEESQDPKKLVKRIAHKPMKKRKMGEPVTEMEIQNLLQLPTKSSMEEEMPMRPKGIADEDYKKFVELVDSLELSTSMDDENENYDSEQNEQEIIDENISMEMENWKRVHFGGTIRPIEDGTRGKCTKSILKNRSEHSPIDEEELQKMEQRDQSQLVPTSKKTLGDEIIERNLNRLVPGPKETFRSEVKERIGVPSRQMRPTPNKRQVKKNRPVSRWKTNKMGLPDEEGEIDG